MNFFHRLITVNETWIYHYKPESGKQFAQWLGHDESRPKRLKAQKSVWKVMGTTSWDTHGILLIDYLQKGKPFTG